ncbi:MAG TPA: DUF975 family protein [Chloroflexota bacterium]|nr:DUF975 family protein [Chloroflexota bacterium]
MIAKSFSMGEALSFGWEVTKAHFLFLVGVVVLAGLIGGLPQAFAEQTRSAALSCVLGIASFVLNTIVGMGLTNIALKLADRQAPELADLFAPAPLFLNYLLAEILYSLMVGIGLVFFIVPGIILGVIFAFYGYVIVDRGAGPIEALGRSAELTKGVRMDLFLFGLLIIGINILGALALGIGLLVSVPVSMVAGAHVYRRLDAQTGPATA